MSVMVDSGLAGSLSAAARTNADKARGSRPPDAVGAFASAMKSVARPDRGDHTRPARDKDPQPVAEQQSPEAPSDAKASPTENEAQADHNSYAYLDHIESEILPKSANPDAGKAIEVKPAKSEISAKLLLATVDTDVESTAEDGIQKAGEGSADSASAVAPNGANGAEMPLAAAILSAVAGLQQLTVATDRFASGKSATGKSEAGGKALSSLMQGADASQQAATLTKVAPADAVATTDAPASQALSQAAPQNFATVVSALTAAVSNGTGSAQPTADLAGSLGQQVIDMGSSGQWIDGLAREIATLSKGEGHGSFRLSPEHLGPMRVDIRPGDHGANVTLTVETKAAESMLVQDRNLLKTDAQLAAVKIGDVTVERVAHVHEPSRADTATGQGTGGHNPNGNSAALAQGQGQSGQSGNQGGNRKVSADATVSSQAEPRDAGNGENTPDAAHRARYA